jgi:acetyl/propionyl-CoA carboxylase alpha subunit
VDDGLQEGMEIPVYYDPMIAKLVVHGSTRAEALERMTRAIDEYVITGVKTTLPFCKFVMQHEAFRTGNFDTHFVSNYYTSRDEKPVDSPELLSWIAAKAFSEIEGRKDAVNTNFNTKIQSNWRKNRLMTE